VSPANHQVDPNSETWRAVEEWIEMRNVIRQSTLECSGMPMDDTENARGAMEELKELRQLGISRPELVIQEAGDY